MFLLLNKLFPTVAVEQSAILFLQQSDVPHIKSFSDPSSAKRICHEQDELPDIVSLSPILAHLSELPEGGI